MESNKSKASNIDIKNPADISQFIQKKLDDSSNSNIMNNVNSFLMNSLLNPGSQNRS